MKSYEAKLVLNKEKGSAYFPGTYQDKSNTNRILLKDKSKAVTALETNEESFRRTVNAGEILSFLIEDSPQGKSIVKWLKEHPLVVTEGFDNPNRSGEPKFTLIIEHEKIDQDFANLRAQLTVISRITDMNDEELIDMAYALGGNPSKQDEKAIALSLIGSSLNGIAVSTLKSDGKSGLERAIEYFKMKKYESEALIYAKKAILNNIIIKEGTGYKVGNTHLGSTVAEIVAVFRTDADLFEGYVKREVDKIDEGAVIARRNNKTFDPENLPDHLKEIIPAVAEKKTSGQKAKDIQATK